MNDSAPAKKRTWLWIVLGVFLVFLVLAIGGIVFTVVYFRQAMTVADMSESRAESEFEAVRARFPGQQPLIRLVDGRPEYVDDRATKGASTTPLETMHVMAWDDDEGKLVTFPLPFWLLRMKSGPIQLSAYSQGWDDRGVSFRIEDLERAGQGIVMDFSERGDRVLIWVE